MTAIFNWATSWSQLLLQLVVSVLVVDPDAGTKYYLRRSLGSLYLKSGVKLSHYRCLDSKYIILRIFILYHNATHITFPDRGRHVDVLARRPTVEVSNYYVQPGSLPASLPPFIVEVTTAVFSISWPRQVHFRFE